MHIRNRIYRPNHSFKHCIKYGRIQVSLTSILAYFQAVKVLSVCCNIYLWYSFKKANVDKYKLPIITVHIVLQMLQIMNFFYQLDTFFKGIKKTVNESKNSFLENQNRSTPISPDLTKRAQDIPCTSKENNSPCSEHILNEEFQSLQLIPSRQQTSLGNFYLNVDL